MDSGSQTTEPSMAADAFQNRRYECRWRGVDGRQEHYWVDHCPTEPHWPPSAVMRWDLRPRDWDKIWPELIDHPCAMLFAPRHPHRDGPRRFKDWVASWPRGFDWAHALPEHLHDAVRQALSDLSATSTVGSSDAESGGSSPIEQPVLQLPPNQSRSADDLVEQLVVALLEVDDSVRPELAQQLQALALAPDSGRVIQNLKNLLAQRGLSDRPLEDTSGALRPLLPRG